MMDIEIEAHALNKQRKGENMKKYECTDRYKALGIPYPNRETMCDGQCEGIGRVPIGQNDREEPWRTLWLEAEKKEGSQEDGTHFVICPDCDGSGKAKKK